MPFEAGLQVNLDVCEERRPLRRLVVYEELVNLKVVSTLTGTALRDGLSIHLVLFTDGSLALLAL